MGHCIFPPLWWAVGIAIVDEWTDREKFFLVCTEADVSANKPRFRLSPWHRPENSVAETVYDHLVVTGKPSSLVIMLVIVDAQNHPTFFFILELDKLLPPGLPDDFPWHKEGNGLCLSHPLENLSPLERLRRFYIGCLLPTAMLKTPYAQKTAFQIEELAECYHEGVRDLSIRSNFYTEQVSGLLTTPGM